MLDGEKIPDRKELLMQQFEAEEEEIQHGPSEEIVLHKPENIDRPRADDGKFKAKAEKEPELPLEVAKAPEPQVWERPPKSWKPEFREPWATLDPKTRQYVHMREEEMAKGVQSALPQIKFAKEINDVIEPYRNTIRGLGIDEKTAISGLLKADHSLRTLPPAQKRDYLLQLASQYGVDLGQGAQGQHGQYQPQTIDPRFSNLQNELVNLKGTLADWQQRQEEAIQQSTLHEINNFAKTVDHFEDVKPTMIQLLQSGMAADLPEAYEKAIRLDPDLSERVNAQHNAQAAQTQIAAKHNAAQKAKAAAVSPKSTTPGAQQPAKAQDRRSRLIEQFDGLSERL